MTKDNDPTEVQEEEEGQHSLRMSRGTVWCAKSGDIITYLTVPSYQSIFPEVIMSKLFPENYVNSASQLLVTSRIVLIDSQWTTITGYASRAR